MSAVIVGGGPAGAATAIALRRRGVAAVVLDRAVFPRDKVCGDVLLPAAQEALAALGLDTAGLEAQAYHCRGARYVTTRGREIAGEYRDAAGHARPWWMVRRAVFDDWLLHQARRAGAVVHEGVNVLGLLRGAAGEVTGVRTAGGAFSARVVVGADGAASLVAREAGGFERAPAHTCLAARAYVAGVELEAPYLEVFTTARTLPGCAWIVPVGPREANVGIGVMKSTADRLRRTPQQLFAELRRELPRLAGRLRHAGPLPLRGWTLPAATEGRRLAGAGYVLVGDAGAMVDPFTGHGIHNALLAAAIAGEVLSDALAAGDVSAPALRRYDTLCRRLLGPDVEGGAVLQRVHASPWLMTAAAEACARHPGLRATFLALVGHTAPRHELLSRGALVRAAARFRGDGAAA